MKGNFKKKGNVDIAKEWDQISYFRLKQLESGDDLSMDHVIMPMLMELCSNGDFSNVIDLGCGTGYITKKIAPLAKKMIGIDISGRSIKEASLKSQYGNLRFVNVSIEDYSELNTDFFSLAIANMTLMDVSNLEKVISGVNKLLAVNGYFVITVTHPYFWPFYWNYARESWFDYNTEIEIEEQFKITNSSTPYLTTHFHRPLSMYVNLLTKNNFSIEQMMEPLPSKELSSKYSKKWQFPRFLGIKCRKVQ